MNAKKELTRDMIIKRIKEVLQPLDYVHSFWEGGAPGLGRLDEWSDLDLYLLVDDDKTKEAFAAVERALTDLSSIKTKYNVPQTPWPGVSQAFYKLENASPYLLLDLAVLKLSAEEKFLEPETHGGIIVYFDKSGVVKPASLDREALLGRIEARLKRIQMRFDIFNIFVQKEINRGNHLEAIDIYRNVTLGTLVELLRIKNNPVHFDFGMHYASQELPPETVERLERLAFVKDPKDLQDKYRQAADWSREIMANMSVEEIREKIRK